VNAGADLMLPTWEQLLNLYSFWKQYLWIT